MQHSPSPFLLIEFAYNPPSVCFLSPIPILTYYTDFGISLSILYEPLPILGFALVVCLLQYVFLLTLFSCTYELSQHCNCNPLRLTSEVKCQYFGDLMDCIDLYRTDT